MGTHINAFKWQVQEKFEVAQKALGDAKQAYDELLAKLSEDGTVEEQEPNESNEEKSMDQEEPKVEEQEVVEPNKSSEEEPKVADTDSKG